eukprot:scaffold17342_cov112-Skeletonema_dohrnii-CCMP3373.AAC.5
MNEPTMRSSPPKASPKNQQQNVNLTGNQRLRAAASFSPYNNPTSMAVRLTGSGGGTSIGAIAGPMGINIVDLAAPQRSLLVLDYSSSAGMSGAIPNNNTNISGGISTMAFQPDQSILQCPSYLSDSNGRSSGNSSQPSSSVLLATARGSGILIWDCSGRALSPLLGRLNAADSWSSPGKAYVESRRSSSQYTGKVDDAESDSGVDHIPPPPLAAASPAISIKSLASNAAATLDTVQPMSTSTPINLERNMSYQSYQSSAAASVVTGNTTGVSMPMSKSIKSGMVTSLAWKGPTVPILISTSGNSVCMWDLRTSLFSGVGVKGGGARPNSRFVPPSQGGSLIHCAYAIDESQHMFSTLDSTGVVRVWDDRKAGNESGCLASFVACSGGGVGIAAIPPSKKIVRGGDSSTEAGPRWLTWGMDSHTQEDELVVKVWSPLSTTKTDADSVDKDDTAIEAREPYQVTSSISMTNAVAARIHPAFSDVVLLFRATPDPLEKETSLENIPEESLATGEQLGMMTQGSPEWRVQAGRSPEMTAVMSTPPSPPPLMLHDYDEKVENDENSSQQTLKGWEAELWRIDTDSEMKVGGKRDVIGAEKISSFRGGDPDEDALSFVPSRSGESVVNDDIIGIDLSLGSKLEGKGKEGNADELVLCSLTKKGYFGVYSIPEATSKEETDDKQDVKSLTKARIYRGHDDNVQPSPWWKGQKEKEEGVATKASPQKDALSAIIKRENSMQFDIELTSPFEEHATIDARNIPIISEEASTRTPDDAISTGNEDLDVSATREVQNVPIDPIKASRVPCPPLCGAVFCAGGAGGLVTFTNGPVEKMFAWYKSSDAKRGNVSSLQNPEMLVVSGSSSIAIDENSDETSFGDRERTIEAQKLPRTVFDLLEMQSSAKIAQWGDENGNNNDSFNEDDASGSSDDSSSSGSGYEEVEVVLDSESSDSDDEGFFHVSKAYNDYFSSSRKSLLGASAESDSHAHKNADKGSPEDENDSDDANKKFAGLSSISPAVTITGKYNDIVFNGQSPELANLLQLGDCWWLAKDFSVPDYGGKNSDIPAASRNDNKSIQRNTSDPTLPYNPIQPGLERTWSLQPQQKNKNKQSSMMGNIKRLMPPGIVMSTPPDQRLIEKKNKQKSDIVEKNTAQSNALQVKDSSNVPLGVYMLENPQTPDAAADRLSITRNLCIQNAEICMDCGQQSKADTWTLLAQTIESMEIFEADVFDGWGGANDALTTGIVEQILRYYESQADYQMLATIVCVLTFGRDRRKSSSKSFGQQDDYQLLPKFDDRRYDNYLYHYASLLYGWGILTVRSEVSKRLAYGIPGGGAEIVSESQTNQEKSTSIVSNTGVTGITFTPICQKCLTPVDETNVCRKCKDYAFQCSICCHAVRGACIWCPMCSHGGHAEHMMSWFENHQMCPTGCGCLCVVGKPRQSDAQE